MDNAGDSLSQIWARIERWPVSSHLWLVILVAFLTFSVSVWLYGEQVPASNTLGPIQHAVALHDQGTFGYSTSKTAVAEPAMFYAPLQIAFIAGAMNLDQNLAKSLRCFAWKNSIDNTGAEQECETVFRPFFFIQALILALVPFFAWLTAWQLSGNKAIAWGSVALVLLSGRQAAQATMFGAEVLTLPLFAALLFSLVAAIQSRNWMWFAAVGLLCGLLSMTQPVFPWLYYGLLVVLSYWRAAYSQNSRHFWRTAAVLVVPYLVIVGPWMWRNYWAFDTSALTTGYVASMMAGRLAWNMMNGLELAVSFVYWLGGIGPDLAMAAYPEDAWRRLVGGAADGFGVAEDGMLRQTLAAAGDQANHMSYLLAEELWPNIVKHLAVTLALFWRGLWVAGYWSLPVLPLAVAYSAVAISRRRTDITMPLFACLFMLASYAFASAALPVASDIFIPLISVLVAMLAGEWVRHRKSQT